MFFVFSVGSPAIPRTLQEYLFTQMLLLVDEDVSKGNVLVRSPGIDLHIQVISTVLKNSLYSQTSQQLVL